MEKTFNFLYDEKIQKQQDCYLCRIWNYLNYSNFVLTFNKLICKRQLKTIESTAFEDDDDSITVAKTLYIFNYYPEKNKVVLSQNLKDLIVVSIHKNYNDEIIIVQDKKVSILYV